MDTPRYLLASLFIIGLGMLASCAATNPQKNPTGNGTNAVAFVRWYEGLWGEQENFCTVSIFQLPYQVSTTFSDIGCDNDEARSVKLENLPPGTVITVYDAKNCGKHDDWGEITIYKQGGDLMVGDFNHSFEIPATLRYDGHYNNGINGKLSCFIIDAPGPNGQHAGKPPHGP
jgi:hypothetical protein